MHQLYTYPLELYIRTSFSAYIAILPLGFLAMFYFYPLASIFGVSFFPDRVFDFSQIQALISTTYYGKILWFTFWQAAASTLLTLLVAVPCAYTFSHFSFRGKRLFITLTGVPFVLPTIVVASAFHAMLGPHGVINIWMMHIFSLDSPPVALNNTIWIILLAHIFYNFTVVLRIVSSFWSKLDPTLVEAARCMGASAWQAFYRVTLPLLLPALCTSGLLVFIFCFCSFGVVLILGGPTFSTLEVAIYRQAVHIFNLPMAAALSLIQIIFTFLLMWGYTWLQRRYSFQVGTSPYSPQTCRTIRQRLAVGIPLTLITVFLGLPLFSLAWQSLMTAHGVSFSYYAQLFVNDSQSIFFVAPFAALQNSLLFGVATLFVAILIGGSAAYTLGKRKGTIANILDPLFMLPLSTSAVTLGFGFIIALDEPPLNLRSSIALVPLAHALVAFPFVVRTILPALRSIPSELREAAAMLGASPWQVWQHIDFPIISKAVAAGAIFAFTISLGEFGATVFVARPQTPTLPLAIYRFLGQPGAINYGQAMAMSTLLMLVSAAGFFLLEHYSSSSMREL